MKKLICLITALTLMLSLPMVSSASEMGGLTPSEYRIKYRKASTGSVYHTNTYKLGSWYNLDVSEDTMQVFNYPIYIEMRFDLRQLFTEAQIAMIENAETVSLDVEWVGDFYTDPADDILESWSQSLKVNEFTFLESYGIGTDTKYLNMYFTGRTNTAMHDIGAQLFGKDIRSMYYYIELYVSPYMGGSIEHIGVKMERVKFVFTVTGIDGGTSQIITNLQGVKDSLDDVEDAINQGFDSVLKPDASDKAQSDKFGSGMSDKVEQGGNILEDMGQMQKPDIDSVIGDDILSDNEADSMVKLMDTVQPILVSALFGRTLLISLILALVAYIFYGKR